MPRRVYIVHWVVGGVGVQVLCPRAVYVSLERILLQEPPRVRVVVPAPQVVCPTVIQRVTFSSSFYQTTKEKGHIFVPFFFYLSPSLIAHSATRIYCLYKSFIISSGAVPSPQFPIP